jgi:hypothetical protein
VPFGGWPGQVALDPEHRAWFSHSPGEPPQLFELLLNVSAGQRPFEQNSGVSHSPIEPRHCTPSRLMSIGQAALEPVHRSSASQVDSTAARQTVDDGANESDGQLPPEHTSSVSQKPALGRQVKPSGATLDWHVSSLPRQNTSTRQLTAEPVAHLYEPRRDGVNVLNRREKKFFSSLLVTCAKSALTRVATRSRCAFERNCFDVGIAGANLHTSAVRATPCAHLTAATTAFGRAHAHIRLTIAQAPSRSDEHHEHRGRDKHDYALRKMKPA